MADYVAPVVRGSLALGAWHDAVLYGYESVEQSLQTNHDGTLAMLQLWSNYEPLRLCFLDGLPQASCRLSTPCTLRARPPRRNFDLRCT